MLIDSASGFGSVDRDGIPLGGQGDAEAFSFHATKPFAIGEGGMISTADARLAHRIRRLANFGLRDGEAEEPGLNAKLSEWAAATALAALERFDEVLARRRSAAAAIVGALAPHGYEAQLDTAGAAWQFVPLLAPSTSARDAALASARDTGVELRSYYRVPLHQMAAWAGASQVGRLDVTEELAGRMLSLPMAVDQTDDDRRRIVAAVLGAS